MTDNKTFPAWLNIDAIVPAELRERIPECAEAAHKVLDAVLDFQTDWGEYIVKMEQAIWERTSEAQAVDAWGYFIEGLVGWRVVEEVLELVDDSTAIVSGSASVSERERFDKLAASAGTHKQQDGLRALGEMRPYGGAGRGVVDPEEGGF